MSKSRNLTTQKPASEFDFAYPWAYFALNDGVLSASSASVANDARANTLANWNKGAAIEREWSTRQGFYTPDGVDNFMGLLRANDSGAFDSVLTVGSGLMLIGMQIAVPRAPIAQTIFTLGCGQTSSFNLGVTIGINTSNQLQCQVRTSQDADQNAVHAIAAVVDGGAAVSITGLSSAGTTATASCSTTPAVGDYVSIYGITNDTKWNGIHRVTAVTAGVSFDFIVSDAPASPAVGTISYAKVGNVWNVIFLVDNRPGNRTINHYRQLASSLSIDPTVGTATAMGVNTAASIGFSHGTSPTNPGAWIGRNARTSNFEYGAFCLRRLLIVNYGASPPVDLVTRVIPRLHRNGMIPSFGVE